MRFVFDDGGRSKYFKGTGGDCVARSIAIVTGHFVAVIDGVIRDTSDPSRDGNGCVYGYWKYIG